MMDGCRRINTIAQKAYKNKKPLLMQMDDLSAQNGMNTKALKRVRKMR